MRRVIGAYITFFVVIASVLSPMDAWAISWKKNLTEALREAKERRAPVMIDFYTKWCRWCKELDRNTYSDRKVNELSAYFVCVKVDADKEKSVSAKYNIKGYPTIVFLNPNRSVNSRIIGYRAPGPFIQAMELALEKSGVVKKKPTPSKKDGMELSGIIINKQKTPLAIINNTFVREGDTINNGKIIRITKDSVDIRLADKTITLKMD